MHCCSVGCTLCRVHWLAVYYPWQTFDVLITAWVTRSTIVLGTSRAGSALLAVYRQWCSLSCGFSCGSVTCVFHGGFLLPGLMGFWVLFSSVGGCHMPYTFANGFISGIGGALCVPIVLLFVA